MKAPERTRQDSQMHKPRGRLVDAACTIHVSNGLPTADVGLHRAVEDKASVADGWATHTSQGIEKGRHWLRFVSAQQ